MSALATNMTNAMQSRAGYLSLKDLLDESTMYYTFKDCIKFKKENIDTWACYWEGSPLVVVMTVKASVLPNGFTKVAILNKEIKGVDEFGMYPSKRSLIEGHILENGKFNTDSGVTNYVTDILTKGTTGKTDTPVQKNSDKKVLSQTEVDHFKKIMAENWGCTFK